MSRIHDALERARRERAKSPNRAETETESSPAPKPVEGGASLATLADCFTQECETLRSAIEAALPGRAQRVIMFTSAVRGEGCTTLVASLAYTLATRGGMRVALVDANIKAPGLAALMGLGPHAGLTDVIGRDLDLNLALRATPTPNLHVLLCGNTPLISSEVFGSSRTASVLQSLKEHHPYVLLDTSAVMSVPEVAMQATSADGVVLVARANKTDRAVLQKTRDILQGSGANLLGVVLNRRRFVIPEFIYRRL
ncbi:MAG: CpsD/CapB family tyrosine-protein kinase [Candidatus Eisenbacteria sp.]|nr:CpsD/CapB family tyrosine-protein kinase [Candidatus Eisenbacteria bacterium]